MCAAFPLITHASLDRVSGGSLETWEWVTRQGHRYAYLRYYGFLRGRKVLDGFWETLDCMGAERNPYRAGFLQLVGVSEPDAQAEADYAEAADYFYNKCLHVYPSYAEAPGYRTSKTIRAGIRPQIGEEAQRIRNTLKWKDFIEQGYMIAGSPATVRERLQEAITMLNVGHLLVLCQFGNLDKERTRKNTLLCANEVMPHLREMWSGWEDHWWPKPMPVRAVPQG